MVMLSFWLPNYMEHACKAWSYQKKKKKKFKFKLLMEYFILLS